MLKDNFNRIHNYLRISLTDNCDLRCFYCMPAEDYQFTPTKHLMQADEIEGISKVFIARGVNKIRLTGGEPLIRKDAAEIIERLAKLPVNLTLTTNGTQLNKYAEVIKNSGIKSINISLDTLKASRFFEITKRNLHQKVLDNIELMLEMGISVKINVVVMKGVNDDEILDFVAWIIDKPLHVRFIEFMPFDGNRWQREKVVKLSEILSQINKEFDVVPLERKNHETAKKFKIIGFEGSFAVISTMSSPFCGDCNRIRLTADGKMKNCLFSQSETDLLTAFRNGEDINPMILGNIKLKKKELGGQFTPEIDKVEAAFLHNRSMITIGG